jgi:outer membrane protein
MILKRARTTAAFVALAALQIATPALAKQEDLLLRALAIMVAPNKRSLGITLAFPTERALINKSVMPELDLTCRATNHIGFELIAATTKYGVSGLAETTGGIGKTATTWVLPPKLTAPYHFNPEGKICPYDGAGINDTIFSATKATPGLESAVGKTNVGLSDSVGWAAQAGADFDLTERVFVNVDVRYLSIKTNAMLSTTAAGV